MGAMALSMKPTGWFQIAWSGELAPGDILPLHYFGTDLVLFRTESGEAVVFDAYCEHLGAHLGYGGRIEGECIVCPFHGWEWNKDGRNARIPYQEERASARRIRTWSVRELNESIYLWHDVENRPPLYEVPDIFSEFEDDASADHYYPAWRRGCISRERLPLHPQYVVENGVDFAHFKYVHRTAEIPEIKARRWDDWSFYAEFDVVFRPSKTSAVSGRGQEVRSGIQALNVGVSLGLSLTWGSDRLLLQVAVTPVDDETSDIRSTFWLERLPGDTSDSVPDELEGRLRIAENQFLADVNIWSHQRYSEPPGLATQEAEGFRTLRRWATRFYPQGMPGSSFAEQDAGRVDGGQVGTTG